MFRCILGPFDVVIFRYTPSPAASIARRHISPHQRFNENQHLSNGSDHSSQLVPPERLPINSLPPDGRNHRQLNSDGYTHQSYQREPNHYQRMDCHQSTDKIRSFPPDGRFSPFVRSFTIVILMAHLKYTFFDYEFK